MKKLLFILLLFVNLQLVINQDGGIELRSFTTAEAQSMGREAHNVGDNLPQWSYPYKCNDSNCGKGFQSEAELQAHYKARPYVCDSCGVKFCTKIALKAHKCYPCKYRCGKVFSIEHERTWHYKYDCPLAPRDSTTWKYCRYCALEFPSSSDRIAHEKVCPYKQKPGSEHWVRPDENDYCIFEYLPQQFSYGSGISGTLESLACIAYEQPGQNHTQQEINAFRSKCKNSLMFDEIARIIRQNYRHSGLIHLGDFSAKVQVISPGGSPDNSNMTYSGGAMIFLDVMGEVVDCAIGYERNNPHNFLTIDGHHCARLEATSHSIVFVNPVKLMNDVTCHY